MTRLILCLLLTGPTSVFAAFQQPSALEGAWVRPCQNGGMQIQIFENQKNYADEIFFEEAQCSNPAFAFLNDGHFELQNNHIDYQFEKVTLVIYSDRLINEYNRRNVCGKSDWKKNDPVEITGLRCELFQAGKLVQVPKAKDMRFGIWKIEDKKLIFGMLSPSENGQTPSSRPSTWDPRAYFKQR